MKGFESFLEGFKEGNKQAHGENSFPIELVEENSYGRYVVLRVTENASPVGQKYYWGMLDMYAQSVEAIFEQIGVEKEQVDERTIRLIFPDEYLAEQERQIWRK